MLLGFRSLQRLFVEVRTYDLINHNRCAMMFIKSEHALRGKTKKGKTMKDKKSDNESIFIRYHWVFWILAFVAGLLIANSVWQVF